MRRRQLEPSQSFTAGMPAKLNLSQPRRYAGGKDSDEQCCRLLLFSEQYPTGTAEGEGQVGPRPHHFFVPPPPLCALKGKIIKIKKNWNKFFWPTPWPPLRFVRQRVFYFQLRQSFFISFIRRNEEKLLAFSSQTKVSSCFELVKVLYFVFRLSNQWNIRWQDELHYLNSERP